MSKVYVVLGAGMQGQAAAYDFAKFGEAARVILADARREVALAAAQKINQLLNTRVAMAEEINVRDLAAVQALLEQADVCLSAVPYYFNAELARAAVRAGCHFCDLGGNTQVVFQEHEYAEEAKQQGVTIAPDCGLAPGMANILAALGISRLQQPKKVHIYVGGLPQQPKPPLGYALFFSIEGLTNEYFGKAHILRDGKITEVEAFSELEEVSLPEPLGLCEAFMTVGGTSTCPWTYAGTLEEYWEKTVRYRGHYQIMKAILDLGLLDETPVMVDGKEIIPRKVFHAVVGPRLQTDDPRDIVALRVVVTGENGRVEIDLIDRYDEATGFTAMQRTTGFGAAIVGIMLANGQFPPGSIRLERDVDPQKYIQEMARRGFNLKMNVTA